MRFGTLYYYSHLFSVVFVSFTACVHRCCEWELTVAWLYIKPTSVPIDEFFFWRDVVHQLVDLIGYSTITSSHSSIHLVLLYLWITIIFPYDYNRYSTPYILEIIINLTSRSGSVVELYMWQVPHQSCCLFMLLIQKTSTCTCTWGNLVGMVMCVTPGHWKPKFVMCHENEDLSISYWKQLV